MTAAATLVVGFGNPLAGDDGAGAAVVSALHRAGIPPRLRAVPCDTDALSLPALWRGEPRIWLVDAVIRRSPPGAVHRMDHAEILAIPQHHGTVHHLSLPESLRWIALAHPRMADVRLRLWGIEPATIALGEPLDPRVRRATVAVAQEIASQHLKVASD